MSERDTISDDHAPSTGDGDGLLVAAAALAVVIAGAWLAVLWLPYFEVGGRSIALTDSTLGDSLRSLRLGPRIVGIALVVLPGLGALAVRRLRVAAWCATAGALLGLIAFSAFWSLGSLEGDAPETARGIALYLDLLLCIAGLATVGIGALGTVRSTAGTRARSTPYTAVTAGGLGVVALVLMTQNQAFLPAMASSSEAMFSTDVSLTLRLVGIASAVVMVALPLLASLTRDRRVTIGLTLGWVAYVAVLATEVVAARDLNPDRIGAPFVLGAVLVVVGAACLIAWAVLADRTADPFARSEEERRARAAR